MTDDDIALAGELALGLLEGEERAAALRRVLADRDFAREVTWWRDRLSGLAAGVPEEAAPDARAAVEPGGRASGAGVWQAIAAVAALIAVAALLLLMLRPDAPLPSPTAPPAALVAALGAPNAATYSVVYDRAGNAQIRPTPTVAAGQEAVAWAIVGTAPPRAIGVVAADSGHVSVPMALRPFMGPGTTVAISLENAHVPVGDAPRGPVIAAGTLAATGDQPTNSERL